jgi:prophage antirepressor-like protein
MNELQIFNNEDFGEIRTVTIDDEPWFVAKDITEKLEYRNGSRDIKRHTDEEDRKIATVFDGTQNRKTVLINESGLYGLIIGSQLPNAKKFKHWITSEVLPTLRRTGTYTVPQTTAGQIQLLAQGHMELEQKIDEVDKDLQEFKKEMPLLAIECQQITEAKNKKIVPLLGGKDSEAYHNASLRGRVYRDLENQLRREFGVTSYKAIHRNQTGKAIDIINSYELPLCLREEIESENAQMRF